MSLPKVVLSDVPVRILFINASPRGRSNSQWMVDKAIEGAQSVGNLEIETFNFRAKKMAPCAGCVEYCREWKKCIFEDDFEKLLEMWLRADGIIWATPVYTFGPPSQVRSWMDRFDMVLSQVVRANGGPSPRFLKPTGIIIQGSSRFGGQEFTAQVMLQHVLKMDCMPISGDMPHADQAVMGQVIDKTTPEKDGDLLHAAFRMGVRLTEMTKLLKLGKLSLAKSLPDVYWPSTTKLGEVEIPSKENLGSFEARYLNKVDIKELPIQIFAVNASPRAPRGSSSQVLLDASKSGAQQVPGVEFVDYSFSQQDINPCRMCISYCSKHEECVSMDDFQEFRGKFLASDGVLWSIPAYHMGPPSVLRMALDRMNELRFQTSRNHQQKQYPRLNKSVGILAHGDSYFGGQEAVQQFFMHHALLLQSLPVTADKPGSFLGVCAKVTSREELLNDEATLKQCANQGLRVAEMAKIFKAGMLLTQDSLADEYFPSKEKMGLIERRPVIA